MAEFLLNAAAGIRHRLILQSIKNRDYRLSRMVRSRGTLLKRFLGSALLDEDAEVAIRGVFVRSALPWTLGIAPVDRNVGAQSVTASGRPSPEAWCESGKSKIRLPRSTERAAFSWSIVTRTVTNCEGRQPMPLNPHQTIQPDPYPHRPAPVWVGGAQL